MSPATPVRQWPDWQTYDNELLDAHFITGDGRGNENIGLTTVHFIFHAEHNRLVEHIKDVAVASNDLAFLESVAARLPSPHCRRRRPESRSAGTANACSRPPASAPRCSTSTWCSRSSRARCSRRSTSSCRDGQVYDTAIDPAIVAEFAHVVYRFGHSMLHRDGRPLRRRLQRGRRRHRADSA